VNDFCPGGDLRAAINEYDYLSEPVTAKFLAEILLAIEEIHKNGIIHRDIKPENILIDGQGHALLSDFGLAKEGIFELQTNTMLGGGLTYQIPEALAEKSYGKSVDLFLFGLLMYEMLTGLPAFPFSGDYTEHQERIKTCNFKFPGDEGCESDSPILSSEAKDCISSLLKPEGKDRITV
jgi:serine/threonine protein kinase